ncbi:hypothetical protein HK096_009230 [Nowakowskiella sp. JEL0078]|nr:hypothetical protein HK096_009230 [Nowakowskiella sp. JEL0078]
MQRLESVSNSPIYALFSETLNGVTTIRAYGHQSRFMAENTKKVNTNHRFYFYLWVSNRWLCLRTDLLSAFATLVSGLLIYIGGVPTGWAGLCLTYTMTLSDVFLWIIRIHAMMEISMNSVERVFEYIDLPQEPPAVIEDNRPPFDWPTEGHIEVKDLEVQYDVSLPPVLHKLTFEVKPGEKIGIVGRTGAGKSSLSLAFFRIVQIQGSITIDGIDISSIGLHDLRSRITIIPQDPVLFSGSLREAIDPLKRFSDDKILEVLERVHFLETIQDLQSGHSALEMEIQENGNNLSLGQRQLVCLGRALLQSNKVVILDEATASVDYRTDANIQKVIRNELIGTILTIAHRLRTVIDYDRIMVLEKGNIVEFDTPRKLLEKDVGVFKTMALETGEFDELFEMSKGTILSIFGL